MSNGTVLRPALLFLLIPLVLFILYPMDLTPGRFLITYHAENFDPWVGEGNSPSFSPDCLQSYFPRRVFARQALLEGRLPLWDPGSFCGQPFLANFQSGVFYPVNLLLLPFSAEESMGLYVWFHLLLAGVGMYLFLLSLPLSRRAALVGALLFAVNGALSARTGQSTMLATPAWIPMVLFLTGRCLKGGGVALLAAAWGCMILSGFPPILLWGFALSVAWALWSYLPDRRTAGWKPLFRVGAGFLLGFGLAAVQLFPTAEFISYTNRIRFTYETLLSSAWHPAALIRFILPGYFGSPIAGEDWTHLLSRGNGHYFQSFISTAGYAGVGALLFAMGGALSWRRERVVRFFLAAGAAGFLVLLGSPILRLVSFLPGLGGARVDRVVHIPVIALVVLAAVCVDRTLKGAKVRRWLVPSTFILAVLLGALHFLRSTIAIALAGPPVLPYLEAGSIGSEVLWSFIFLAGSVALASILGSLQGGRRTLFLPLALLILVADPGLVSRRCHVTVERDGLPAPTRGIQFLADRVSAGRVVRYNDNVVPPNLPGLFGLNDVAGYNALTIRHYRRYFSAMAPPSVKERRINPLKAVASVKSPLLDRLAARWVISGAQTVPPDLPMVYDGEMRIFENENAYPRAFLTYRLVTVESPGAALQLLSHPKTPSGTTCLEKKEIVLAPDERGIATVGEWVSERGGLLHSFDPADLLDDKAKLVLDEPERIQIDCASKGERMLVLADTWYPGWKADLDGEPVEIHRVNRIFRGVLVPGGVHRVEFRYEPDSFRLGMIVSLVSVLLVTLVGVFIRHRNLPTTVEAGA